MMTAVDLALLYSIQPLFILNLSGDQIQCNNSNNEVLVHKNGRTGMKSDLYNTTSEFNEVLEMEIEVIY